MSVSANHDISALTRSLPYPPWKMIPLVFLFPLIYFHSCLKCVCSADYAIAFWKKERTENKGIKKEEKWTVISLLALRPWSYFTLTLEWRRAPVYTSVCVFHWNGRQRSALVEAEVAQQYKHTAIMNHLITLICESLCLCLHFCKCVNEKVNMFIYDAYSTSGIFFYLWVCQTCPLTSVQPNCLLPAYCSNWFAKLYIGSVSLSGKIWHTFLIS